MSWTASTVSFIIFGSGAVAMAIGAGALRKRPDPMAWPLALMMFAVVAWAIPHAISLGYTDVEQVSFWHRMRYPGTVFTPVLYLVVSLKYAGYDRLLSRRLYGGLVVVPVLTVVAVWTNQFHGLFWASTSVVRVGATSVFVPEYGPWYWVNLGYLYLITAVGLLTLLGVVVRAGRLYRKQAGLMFVGGIVPLAVNGIVNVAAREEAMIDFTTTALAVSGVTFAVALFYLDALELRPVARDRLVEELDDGVVVIGPDDRIQDFNPVASDILGGLAMHQSAEDAFPTNATNDGGDLVVDIDGRERFFRTRETLLRDERGRNIGRIVHLNDVTRLVMREQRISVLNRVLRHNIRNQLNVASGRLTLVDGQLSTEAQEEVDVVLDTIDRVVAFAEKARYVEETLRAPDTMEVVSVTSAVERVVTEARQSFTGAVVESTLSTESEPGTFVRVVDGELFEMALGELVENGVKHNDTETPHVSIDVDSVGGRTRVSVTDNGPGIPDEVTDVLNERTETALNHGDGLGLWLVRWTASLSSGELSFSATDPRGCVVTLSLPTAVDGDSSH